MFSMAGIIALGSGLGVGVIHFFSENLKPQEGPKYYRIFSFAAGISISYLFLDLLPHTYEAATHLKNWVFIFLLLGFSIHHLSEKYIYRHAEANKVAWELHIVHSIGFFFYYFIIGIVVKNIIQDNVLEGILFMIPISLHAGLSTASLAQIHGDIRESSWVKILLSFPTLLGVLFAMFISIPAAVNNVMVSLIAGVLLYIFVKEFIPEKKKGAPLFFLFGLGLFLAFFVILNMARR